MRFRLFPALPFVHIDIFVRVNWQWAIWIDGNQEQPRVCIDQVRLVPHVQIMDDGSFVEVRELCHVIGLIELGRIDLVYAVCTDFPLLSTS